MEKCVVYTLESAACGLLLAAALVTPPPDDNGGSVDTSSLVLALQLSGLSANMLMAGILFPLGITVYNSFIIPVIEVLWSSDANRGSALCTIALSCVMMPYSIATSFFDADDSGAMDVVAELEGAGAADVASDALVVGDGGGVSLATSALVATFAAKALKRAQHTPHSRDRRRNGGDDDNDGNAVAKTEAERETVRVTLSQGARKRMKRERYLKRVRQARACRIAESSISSTRSVQEFDCSQNEAGDAQANVNVVATAVRRSGYLPEQDPLGMDEAQVQEWRLNEWMKASQIELEYTIKRSWICDD